MTDVQENKRIASSLFERFTAGDTAGVMNLMAEDATWWIAGRPAPGTVCGTLTKAQVGKLFGFMTGALDGPLAMTVKSAIGEGDEVALEVESLGHLKSGRTYNQHYHFRIRIAGGKIAAVREYLDTQHVREVWSA
jgi:ketosteroid isomerase-like protein